MKKGLTMEQWEKLTKELNEFSNPKLLSNRKKLVETSLVGTYYL